MLSLIITKKTDPRVVDNMGNHYSQPKGFVGRSIIYSIEYDGVYYGSIAGGSSTLHLPGRHEFLQTDQSMLNNIVNNIFFHCERVDGKYPTRNFLSKVLLEYERRVKTDWAEKYGDDVVGYETLVELPRTGEIYLRNGWSLVGTTKGLTCKRVGNDEAAVLGLEQTEKWGGIRVWDKTNLRPKLVLCKRVKTH